MKVDIITGKEIKGGKAYRVKEDKIIEVLRAIKKRLGQLKGNELFVSEENLEAYKKKRKKFETNLMIVGGISVIILLLTFALPLLSLDIGKALSGLLLSIIISALLFILAITQYVPAIEEEPVSLGKKQRRRKK